MIRRRSFILLSSLSLAVCLGAGYLFAQAQSASQASSPRATQHDAAIGNESSAMAAPATTDGKNLANARLSRFAAVDIVIDSQDQPLAAYQLTFSASRGDIVITSIEGGEHAAFAEPPFYDPKAIQNQRAILAGFSTKDAKDLPKGRTRVATVHVEIRGDVEPEYEWKLDVAATVGGETIPAQVSVQSPKGAL